jgi:hypothetical protein
MFLTRLVYASTISENFSSSDIEEILKSARKHNKINNVTGMLCFNRKFFLQCLEGSRTKVNEAYHKILNDNRHSKIVLLDYKEIDMREFSNWSMGFMPESSLTAPINLKYSGRGEFLPYEMSGESAHQMMLELRELTDPIS